MNGDKRNFSLSIWDHKDNFICNLKSANSDFEGQSFNENFVENINGEKTLSFSIPMYIFSYDKNNNNLFNFEPNEAWKQIKNEQKIRYIEYHPITNKPIQIEEFVLKEFTESRNGEEKIADCICESLAVYELGKVGWGITFDTNYITDYELKKEEVVEGITTSVNYCPDLLTLDYWMKKLLYKETNLGRVSNTTECTYLLQGLQLRDDEGYPIDKEIITTTTSITRKVEYKYNRVQEPICNDINSIDFQKYYNPTGWHWEIEASFENDPNKQSISTLYEVPVINQFIESYPDYFVGQSYQKRIGTNDSTKELRIHPIPEHELNEWTYVTDVKKRLISEERSNIFSIIQNLCETFEVWAFFQYHYSNDGKIDDRKILFKTETIDENIKFDFSYGKNLQSCSRIINSNELITKLYVTNTESNLIDGNILSIQQSSANPTGENYIYNFDYFYDSGILTKEKDKGKESDEYQINLHCGKLRKLNNKIVNIQKFLTPLYDRRNVLEGDLTIEEGSRIGFIDNIQDIQNKIDAIPPGDQIIKSWSNDNSQYNHVGDLKTFSTTTNPNNNTETDWFYLNFGREDILIGDINYNKYYLEKDNNGTQTLIEVEGEIKSGFTPKMFSYSNWHSGNAALPDNDTSHFISFIPGTNCIYDYSSIGNKHFIKGIYFSKNFVNNNTYGRIRYKYAPLIYYYLLIKDYWDKIGKEEIQIDDTKEDLLTIKNKIILYELQLKKLLQEKNEFILQFENKYKSFIREGYWEPSDYQSEFTEEIFDSYYNDNFNYFTSGTTSLNLLTLNDSLFNYSYYFSLGNANEIDIDSIKMRIRSKITNDEDIYIPQYQSNNYELYLSGSELICAIDPDIINNYINIKNYNPSDNKYKKYFQSTIDYFKKNGEFINSREINWINSPEVNINIPKIYLNNENIITNKLQIYGESINDNNLLTPYIDYSYIYESVGYDSNNTWVDLSDQHSYSTDIQYKYDLRIDFKLTNNTIRFLASSHPKFIVTFGEEKTLQYIYNDSVATSKKYSIPKVEYNISVVDLSSLNGYENYKPKIGQKVPIFDMEMNFYNFQGFITSINYPLEEKYNTELTIATYGTKFEDVFQKLTATMVDINYNSNEIYKAANSFETNGAIKTDVFKRSLQENFEAVNLGINNEISIDEKEGITLHDKDNNSGIKLIGRGIFLTKDITLGENTEWRTGITGEGINTNVLTAGSLDTKQITIWNSSEKQARFIWNEQGLFAYGDKFGTATSTETSYQELIDYNKYVKYNQEGLEFNDNGKSALSLGWNGLKISTQENGLILDADNGLTLLQENNGNIVTRLELGKLDQGQLYGLRLKDTLGNITLQSDSRGDLWLHQYISLGGSIENGVVKNPNAGIYGLIGNNIPIDMQMGIRRDNNGKVIWDFTPIRFWAGPQTKEEYSANIHISNNDILNTTNGSNFNNLSDNTSPSLAKFKVSAKGDIIASGIDVGGWIGQGEKLRSFDNEAILRSNKYSNSGTDYPVIAIGKPTSNADTNYGTNYNFRVYQDGTININKGSININNGVFKVESTGKVTATNITIQGNNTNISGGHVGGLQISNGGLEITAGGYKTAIYANANSNLLAFQAGPESAPSFAVNGKGEVYINNGQINITSSNTKDIAINVNSLFTVTKGGEVTASKIKITGNSNATGDLISAGNFIVTQSGSVTAKNIVITGSASSSNNLIQSTNFTVSQSGTVTAKDIIFDGNLHAKVGSVTYSGLDTAEIATWEGYTWRIVKGLVVGRKT